MRRKQKCEVKETRWLVETSKGNEMGEVVNKSFAEINRVTILAGKSQETRDANLGMQRVGLAFLR